MKQTLIILALINRISALTQLFSAQNPQKIISNLLAPTSGISAFTKSFSAQKTQKIISNLLIISVVLLVFAACTAKKDKPKTKPPVPVKVAKALQKDVPVQVKAIGNIEAFTSVAIKSQVSGQIARVHFREGSDVAKGALLISLDPEPFQATLSQCEAALARDQAQAKFAREQTSRYEGLLREGIVTHDQYDQLRTNAESFAATVAADRAAVKNARIQLGYCSIVRRSPVGPAPLPCNRAT